MRTLFVLLAALLPATGSAAQVRPSGTPPAVVLHSFHAPGRVTPTDSLHALGGIMPADSLRALDGISPRDSLHVLRGIMPADTLHALEEITVTATRWGLSATLASQRVTRLDRNDVAASAARTVAELLSARGGMFVRTYGQGLATASMRGASPSQSLILLDGMRLADPQLGQFDLSLLPAHLLDAVEVMHGPASALYGSDGMAGVIHLRHASADRERSVLLTEAGAFGSQSLSGGMARSASGVSVAVSGEVARSEGDFPYVNRALFPPREVRRRNADRERRSFFASVAAEVGSHRLQGGALVVSAEQGLPGLATTAPVGERQWDGHVRFWMEDRIAVRRGDVRLRAFLHRSRLRYLNPALSLDATGRTWAGSLESEARLVAGRAWLLSGGVAGAFASAEHPSLAADASEVHTSAFASGSGHFGLLRLYPAARGDVFFRHDGTTHAAVSPRVGLNVGPVATLPLHMKANAGGAFRAPTFNDRFWQPGGNPDLDPERSWSVEGGVTAGARRLRGEATVFRSGTSDQIVWVPQGTGSWAPENLRRTVTHGAELSIETALPTAHRGGATAGLTYAWTSSVDRSDPSASTYGRQLRYVPRHQVKAFVSLDLAPLHVNLHARYLGRRYVTADESEWLPGAFVLDANAGASRDVGAFRLRLSLVVENVLDAEYAVIKHYPMPPRHVRLRLLIESRSP